MEGTRKSKLTWRGGRSRRRSVICGAAFLKWLRYRKGRLCPIESISRVMAAAASALAGSRCVRRSGNHQMINRKYHAGNARAARITKNTNMEKKELWTRVVSGPSGGSRMMHLCIAGR